MSVIRKFFHPLGWFLLGAACFFVSQPLLRMPLLNLIQSTADYELFYILHPLATIACVGFSAGLFEEGFRFLFKSLLLRPAKSGMLQPILFGLGHGITEACILILPALAQGTPWNALWLGIVERILSVILHVGLTILVWNGFQTGKKFLYLAAAILVHGLVNTVLPVALQSGLSPPGVELAYGGMVAVMGVYMAYSKK